MPQATDTSITEPVSSPDPFVALEPLIREVRQTEAAAFAIAAAGNVETDAVHHLASALADCERLAAEAAR